MNNKIILKKMFNLQISENLYCFLILISNFIWLLLSCIYIFTQANNWQSIGIIDLKMLFFKYEHWLMLLAIIYILWNMFLVIYFTTELKVNTLLMVLFLFNMAAIYFLTNIPFLSAELARDIIINNLRFFTWSFLASGISVLLIIDRWWKLSRHGKMPSHV